MKRVFIALGVLLLIAAAPQKKVGVLGPVFCVDKTNKPCGRMPHDVTEFFGYGSELMSPGTQDDFDNFSWQSFVALNWPANANGTPNLTAPLTGDMSIRRVWSYYKDADEVFLPNGAVPDLNYPSKSYPPPPAACVQAGLRAGERFVGMSAKINDQNNVVSSFDEAAVNVPLVDSAGNFVVFDVMMNNDEFQYIAVQNKYYNSNGQKGAAISFPPGKAGGAEGAIELKTAWKVLTAMDNQATYIRMPMRIYVPAAHSSTGKDFCTKPLPMGLVGIHILHKGTSQRDWIWSTFEHVNNAPLSSTPVDATSKTPSGPCKPPTSANVMSFYNPACTTCPINAPPVQPGTPWVFSPTQPYASKYLTGGKYGTQVVRCSSIWNAPGATQALNDAWRKVVPQPYASYMLIGSQWEAVLTLARKAAHSASPQSFGPGVANGGQALRQGKTANGVVPAPPYLQNTAAETYLQNAAPLTAKFGVGSCLGCHTGSKGAACEDADFSFMLGRAQPKQDCKKAGEANVAKALAAPKTK
jgi:hypothetical protein